MRGAGTVTCGQYAEDRASGKTALTFQFATYTQGYLSAFNDFATTRTLNDIPKFETIFLFIDRYCKDNPLNKVQTGIDSLIAELGGLQVSLS